MTPEISEFSYGFALTNELVGWTALSAAPIFPSLIEEGRKGGGYDVKLDYPAVPMYLQFKRADCMKRKSAMEIKNNGLTLDMPFYRFKITESGKSNQHQMLLGLDDGRNAVFYAAPRFHELSEINRAWLMNEVASRSIFVRPSAIGRLDAKSHHVAYDKTDAFLFSEPKAIDFLVATQVANMLLGKLKEDTRPLRARLPELIASVERAVRQGRTRGSTSRGRIPLTGPGVPLAVVQRDLEDQVSGPETRSPRPLLNEYDQLRRLADTCSKDLSSQLIVVQPA